MVSRLLITGGLGQMAKAVERTLSDPFELLMTSRRGSRTQPACDITRWKQVSAVVADFRPQVVINTAAYTDVDGCELDPDRAREVNVTGVEHLLSAVKKVQARLVHFSSDYVFDGETGPYLEDDPTHPLCVYGQTKLESEQLLQEEGGHLVLRVNVVFGPGDESPASFVRWVANSLQGGETINVVNDQINNPTLTTHIAQALEVALRSDTEGLYHYGGLEFVTRFEFARLIARHYDLDQDPIVPISTAELDQPARRPLNGGLICSRMKRDLDVKNYSIAESLEQAFHRA